MTAGTKAGGSSNVSLPSPVKVRRSTKGDRKQTTYEIPAPRSGPTVDLERKDDTILTAELDVTGTNVRMFYWHRRRAMILSVQARATDDMAEAERFYEQVAQHEDQLIRRLLPGVSPDDVETLKKGWMAPMLVAVAQHLQPGAFELITRDEHDEA